jgi:hypothetical protein
VSPIILNEHTHRSSVLWDALVSLLDFWNETNFDMFKKQRFALNDLLRV